MTKLVYSAMKYNTNPGTTAAINNMQYKTKIGSSLNIVFFPKNSRKNTIFTEHPVCV